MDLGAILQSFTGLTSVCLRNNSSCVGPETKHLENSLHLEELTLHDTFHYKNLDQPNLQKLTKLRQLDISWSKASHFLLLFSVLVSSCVQALSSDSLLYTYMHIIHLNFPSFPDRALRHL